MMVQAQEEMGEGSANPTDPYHTPSLFNHQHLNHQKNKSLGSQKKGTEVPQPSGLQQYIAREKAKKEKEANILSYDNVQAMIDVDYQMAQQMQAEEQEKLSLKKYIV
ncbi:hypothetical protein Tco_0509601 [Tanacetum coccineum]|uniref:No apical meristem-associated C-terminal domain-containing protein n=1 Tax=Tanacetum coccineum TaxID=301880 RepID=A0ABQ5DK85_9ASTR